jgi:hypothetical protein
VSIQEKALDQLPDRLKRAAMSMTLRTSPPVMRPSLGGLPDDAAVRGVVEKVMHEPKKAAFIDCYWRGYDIFRIELKDANDALVRTITSDGRWIDTGSGTLWDIRFLKEYRGAPPDLQEEFDELMWPYRLFSGLLFPVSEGGRFDFRQLKAWYDFDEREGAVNQGVSKSSVTLDYRHKAGQYVREVRSLPYKSVTLDIERGYMPLRVALMQEQSIIIPSPLPGAYPLEIHYVQYEDPVRIDDIWIPKTYRNMLVVGGSAEEISRYTLVMESREFITARQSDKFQIPDYAEARIMKWPDEDDQTPEEMLGELRKLHEEIEETDERIRERLAEPPPRVVAILWAIPSWVFTAFGIALAVAGCLFLVRRRQARRG